MGSERWRLSFGCVIAQWSDRSRRRITTRYDKPAANFLGNIHLAAAMMW